jgi:hypothetical protein
LRERTGVRDIQWTLIRVIVLAVAIDIFITDIALFVAIQVLLIGVGIERAVIFQVRDFVIVPVKRPLATLAEIRIGLAEIGRAFVGVFCGVPIQKAIVDAGILGATGIFEVIAVRIPRKSMLGIL